MNKLSILTILSLIVFVNCLNYDLTITFANRVGRNYVSNVTISLPKISASLNYKILFEPANQEYQVNGDIKMKVEDIKEICFEWNINNPDKNYSVYLSYILLTPNYIKDQDKRFRKIIRLFPKQYKRFTLSKEVKVGKIECLYFWRPG